MPSRASHVRNVLGSPVGQSGFLCRTQKFGKAHALVVHNGKAQIVAEPVISYITMSEDSSFRIPRRLHASTLHKSDEVDLNRGYAGQNSGHISIGTLSLSYSKPATPSHYIKWVDIPWY